jgi:hypothetical protein
MTDSSQRMFGSKFSTQGTFKKSRNSAAENIVGTNGKRTSSPKNQFMGLNKESKLSQKLGPISATAKKTSAGNIPITDVSSSNYKKYTSNKNLNASSTRVRSGLHQESNPIKKV